MKRTAPIGERAFLVQHAENPMMFLAGDKGADWTLTTLNARHYRSERGALRAIVTRLNGRGHVLPLVYSRRTAA